MLNLMTALVRSSGISSLGAKIRWGLQHRSQSNNSILPSHCCHHQHHHHHKHYKSDELGIRPVFEEGMPRIIYIGCIGVKTSMRSLRQRERAEVASEAINRLCEANNIEQRSRPDGGNRCATGLALAASLDDKPNLSHSCKEVELSVTKSHLNVISCEDQKIIIQHEMPNVSFASVGDEDTADFVAYVAKDAQFGRACFVLRCGHDEAKGVLQEIAQAFQSRTEWMNKEQGTRAALELEPWFHGSYLNRDESELKLINEGDFLVRECTHKPDHFVLSVMHNGEKLHLFFDTKHGQVKTKDKTFDNISQLVKNHHENRSPIIANDRKVYLLNGVLTE